MEASTSNSWKTTTADRHWHLIGCDGTRRVVEVRRGKFKVAGDSIAAARRDVWEHLLRGGVIRA